MNPLKQKQTNPQYTKSTEPFMENHPQAKDIVYKLAEKPADPPPKLRNRSGSTSYDPTDAIRFDQMLRSFSKDEDSPESAALVNDVQQGQHQARKTATTSRPKLFDSNRIAPATPPTSKSPALGAPSPTDTNTSSGMVSALPDSQIKWTSSDFDVGARTATSTRNRKITPAPIGMSGAKFRSKKISVVDKRQEPPSNNEDSRPT